jgi:dephospho-CoA kinase
MNLAQVKQRLQAQATDTQREEISDTIIQNDKSPAELLPEVERVWELLQLKNRSKS